MDEIVIIKNNAIGDEVFRYKGTILNQTKYSILIEAYFTFKDRVHFGMPLQKGDRFVEEYFSDRWYNIYEIHIRESDKLRGWYCNISTPAIITRNSISFNDLALDLLVFPDGSQSVLDKDEFDNLLIPKETKIKALSALSELQELFQRKFRR